MATQIETYEVEEIATNADDCAESRELIRSLGLEGQEKLATATGTIFPYRKMTQEEQHVYGEILPQKTRVKDYASGSIPLRVLQVLAHATALEFFDYFEVWHPQDVRKDPLLVGCKKTGESWREPDRFLLARWGEVLENFEALKEKAIISARLRISDKAREAKSKADGVLATIEDWPFGKLFTETIFY